MGCSLQGTAVGTALMGCACAKPFPQHRLPPCHARARAHLAPGFPPAFPLAVLLAICLGLSASL